MDWDLAIKRNSEALNGIIEVLFALLGLDGTDAALRIPRSLHSAVLRVLRPAESAVRRLIVIAARGLVVKLAPSRPMPAGTIIGKGGGSRPSLLPALRSAETFPGARAAPRKFTRIAPRIHFFGPTIPGCRPCFQRPGPWLIPRRRPMAWSTPHALPQAPSPQVALDDLPRQARRLARWRQRREAAPSPKFISPLRPGHPPGYRRKPIHEVDEVLTECDGLAWEAMKPDTC